jgi:RNA polymerase sigma-70 factor (ECF subfamily)
MQEILYQLWRSHRLYDGRATFSTWMYRIAVNTAISGLRKLHTMVATEPLDEGVAASLAAATDESRDDLLARLHAAIRQLEPVQRAVVIMFLDGLPYREIAAALGTTENAIGVRMHRIRARLSELLEAGP